MKKKIIIFIVVVLVIMLIPVPIRLKDGGSIEYKAILYKYTKIHRLNENSYTGYEDGWDLKILGIHVGGTTDVYITAEHKINIRSNDKMITANTGGFCYKSGACIDKVDFQDFEYDSVMTYYGNKLYIDNLDGNINSVELFNYSIREFTNIKVDFTNEYIITPNVSGPYIFVIKASYEGKSIDYYFLSYISKTSGEDINLKMEIKENSLSNVGLTMIIKNLSNRDLQYGNPFSIEKYENGFWVTEPTINDLFFTMPAFSLNKGESKELNINWEYGYGKLKGKYRIVKDFSYKENDDHVKFLKYLEFEI